MTEIVLDLHDVTDTPSLFAKFDGIIVSEWGRNYDALYDCLSDLFEGGFTQAYDFPLTLSIMHWEEFQSAHPHDYERLTRVFTDLIRYFHEKGKVLKVNFV